MGKAGLMQRNGVKVTFNDDYSFQTGNGITGHIQREECLALLEQRRIRRVQILRRAFAKDASSESHHTPTEVNDGKHHTTAKPIVTSGRMVSRHRQSSCRQLAR